MTHRQWNRKQGGKRDKASNTSFLFRLDPKMRVWRAFLIPVFLIAEIVTPRPAYAQNGFNVSAPVTVTPTPTSLNVGESATVQISATLSLINATITSSTLSCTVNGASVSVPNASWQNIQILGLFDLSTSFTILETTAGTYNIDCKVSGGVTLNPSSGGTYTGTFSGEESAQVTYVTGKDCTGSAVTPQGATTQSGGGITSTTWNGLTIQAYPPGGPTPSTASTSGLGITGDSGYYDCDGDPLSTGGEQDATIASNAPYSPGNDSVNITWSVTEWSYQLGDDCSSCDSNPGGTSSVDAESSVVTPAASVTAWCF